MRSNVTGLLLIAVLSSVAGGCASAPSVPPSVPGAHATPTRTATASPAPASMEPSPTAAPATTADGQIVFEDAGRDFQFSQVWIENADGSNVRQLVSDDYTDSAASLSPDGRTVAFDRTLTFSIDDVLADATLSDQIMLVNVDGSGLHQLATHPDRSDACWDGIEGGRAFSPDGSRIVFFRLCPRTASVGLWTINVDGTDAQEVTGHALSPKALLKALKDGTGFPHLEDHRASWSSDGRRLAFERIDATASSERAAIFTIGADGTGVAQVTPWKLDANDPDWSPDGSRIAFNSPAEPARRQNIYSIRPDGTALWQLTHYDKEGQQTFHPSWSPDGGRMLFSHDGDLYVMNADGGDPHVLGPTALLENHGSWGPSPAP